LPINPFEPPQTTDLDRSATAVQGSTLISDEALRELAAAAPWVRWLARVTSLSIAVAIMKAFVSRETLLTMLGITWRAPPAPARDRHSDGGPPRWRPCP
jgi:hypothetical protein